jgi:hypothetical protein
VVARSPLSTARLGGLSADVFAAVRTGVRDVLEATPHFRLAPPAVRRRLAERMVAVAASGAQLLEVDRAQTARLEANRPLPATPTAPLPAGAPPATAPSPAAPPRAAPPGALAQALEGAPPSATGRAAQAVRDLRAAIDFPTYVQSLISGVFQAITRSNLQQLESIAEMLDHVASSSEAFTDSNVPDDAARQWVAGHVPGARLADGTLAMAEGAELDPARLKEVLGATDSEVSGIDPSDLDGTLVPLARRKMGRDRQSLLATMVQMGLQRIVVDEGQLTAQMEMRVDAHSVEQQLQRERTELGVNAGASASFGMGAWGASAHVDTTYSKVNAEDRQRTEDLGLRAQLYSHVQLAFRTEQIPLDRMADARARVHISNHARVPDLSQSGATTGALPTLPPGELTTHLPSASSPPARPAPGAPGGASPGGASGAPPPPAPGSPAPGGAPRPAGPGGTAGPGGAAAPGGAPAVPRPAGAAAPGSPGGAAPASPGGAAPGPPGGAAPASPGAAAPASPGGAAPASPGAAAPRPPSPAGPAPGAPPPLPSGNP